MAWSARLPRTPSTAPSRRAPKPRKCADLFRAEPGRDLDGIIVTLPNFGDERGVAETVRMAGLNVPVLVQATPDTASKMTIADRRDSFCGKMSACNNLTQYRHPVLAHDPAHRGAGSAEFAKDLEWFAAVCRVVKGLRNLRIGAIGARPRRSTRSATARRSWNATASPSSRSTVRNLRPHRTDEGRRCRGAGKLAAIQGYVSTSGIPADALMKMAKLGAVIDGG